MIVFVLELAGHIPLTAVRAAQSKASKLLSMLQGHFKNKTRNLLAKCLDRQRIGSAVFGGVCLPVHSVKIK